jgi:hypothetical protein
MGRSVELEFALLFLEADGPGAENGGPQVRQIGCSYHMAGPEQSIAAVFFFCGVATA